MLRYTLLTLVVGFLSIYAFKDWYKALCGLIVMMSIIERYDMPRQMFGVTGLNPWNLLMLFILVGWFISRKREQLSWTMPREITVLLICYFVIIVIGFSRMLADIEAVEIFNINAGLPDRAATKDYFIDDIFNSLKYVLPGLLLFHGCNSASRLRLGMGAIMLTLLLLGLQIIKWMPLGYIADGEALAARALSVLNKGLGYHRVDLAALMAAGSWAFVVSRSAFQKAWQSRAMLGLGALLILSLALTGGRTGYATWVALGLMVAVLKYRRLLFAIPVMIILVVSLVPAVQERMLEGFGSDSSVRIVGEETTDLASVTSGRILVWPLVLESISEKPFFGWGRRGFHLSGSSQELFDLIGQGAGRFNHPHNAYLELILDNGLIGALPIFLFFGLTLWRSNRLFQDKDSPLIAAAGGICLVLTTAQLVASLGAQSFYPRAGVVLMWCSIGLMYAVYSRSRYGRRATEE
ncbi:MAG: O-antigen ligase family protein [Gammaproteobacteria bacterium]|nr:O-antigen ligase family protein [Gammaproteobacteria bacterium]MDH5260675.1 O-antigen ligase family protein [Gammaproteobacteria bacterium]